MDFFQKRKPADFNAMDILIMIILGIVGGVMIATVAASGIYYTYRTKKDKDKEKAVAKITSAHHRRSARIETEPFVQYQDESLVDFDSVPVQPETRRPIRSPDDVYPPVRVEEQDDYLLSNLDMDFSITSVIPPEDTIERKGCLEFTLHYYQLSSTLTLTLIRLGDLPLRLDTGMPPDPLVEFEVKYAHDGKIRSEVYQSTCNPHMYESFRFEVAVSDLGNQTLTFKVIDLMKTNLPEPPPPPPPEEGNKKKKKKKQEPPPPAPPPPPPPPPTPTLIGFVTVPLVSVAMKKLLADTEITVLRDVIKLKPRRSSSEKVDTTGGETMASTTGTDDFEEQPEPSVEAEENKEEEKENIDEDKEEETEVVEQDEPDTSQVEEQAIEPVAPKRPSVSFSGEVDSDVPGPALLISLAYLKSSEKLTVIVMKAKNLKPISKNKKPDPLVKVYVKMGDKKLKKRSTLVKKHDVPPVWNEAFNFAIPHRILHKISVLLQVKHISERGKKSFIGKVVIGSTSNDEAVDHWNAMLTSTSSVAKWHQLEEENPSTKKTKTTTKQKAN